MKLKELIWETFQEEMVRCILEMAHQSLARRHEDIWDVIYPEKGEEVKISKEIRKELQDSEVRLAQAEKVCTEDILTVDVSSLNPAIVEEIKAGIIKGTKELVRHRAAFKDLREIIKEERDKK